MFFLIQFRRDLWRSKTRSLLTVGIALFLFGFAGVYFGNIAKSEILLHNLADSIPVPMHVTNAQGTQDIGLEIEPRKIDALLSADIRNPVCTVQAAGNWKQINRVEHVRNCDTTVLGVSGAAGLSPEQVRLAEGRDLFFLAGSAPECLLTAAYARENALGPGDTMTFPLYVYKHGPSREFQFDSLGEVSLRVVGILTSDAVINGISVKDTLVPAAWLRSVAEGQGKRFFYDSFRCTLNNPLELNRFKDEMTRLYFSETRAGAREGLGGDALVIQDKVFIETAVKIRQNIDTLNRFQVPVLAVTVLIVMLAVFLLSRGQRRQLAIAGSLGQSRRFSAAELFAENLFLVLVGCLLAVPILSLAVGVGMDAMLRTLALFGGCAALGIGCSVALLFRFDALRLLTQAD